MSINTSGLPAYTEQITKKVISNTIINDLRFIEKVKQEKLAKSLLNGKNKK